MIYQWTDYSPEYLSVIETFLDDTARTFTGCDEGWQEYYECLLKEPSVCLGKNFWTKVISLDECPIAVIALGLEDGRLTVSELIVSHEMRKKGHGTKILRELLMSTQEIFGVSFRQAFAVIFPDNHASQRAFEKAGFVFESAHPDGDAWNYVYDCI
ncbi:MAG: GNAT family N-acetyltransferase [Clostridia bacterium]|nr:GNAT family N-acetyltransferase [Clostridia bacterium]